MVWGSNSKAAEIRLYEYKDWFLTESVFFDFIHTKQLKTGAEHNQLQIGADNIILSDLRIASNISCMSSLMIRQDRK